MSAVIPTTIIIPAAAEAQRLTRTEWCLRIGAAACFIGHGAFGIITKESWLPYFAVVGIGRDLAYVLMPVIGTVDIVAGVLVLLSPRPVGLLYMAIWGLLTALMRPLAGESFFEALERAGNYGVPLALLAMFAMRTDLLGLFQATARRESIDRALPGRVLLWSTATLLFAHGALQAITQEAHFATHYAALGLPPTIVPILGVVEMVVAVLVLAAPAPALLITVAVWKVATEMLFPLSGSPVWEFVERGGSYAAPIALVLLSGNSPFTRIQLSRSNR